MANIAAHRSRASVAHSALAVCLIAAQPALSQQQPDAAAGAETGTATTAAASPGDADLAAAVAAGEGLYLKNRRACHGSKGTAGVPLAGNEKVAYGYDYLVWAIITGPGYMPEFGPALPDDEIAAIATYVLNS